MVRKHRRVDVDRRQSGQLLGAEGLQATELR